MTRPPDPYAGDYFFYNYDCRGSTTAVIAPTGTLTTGYTYDEFGNQTRTGATDFLNEVTFTGSVSDTASGLQYMNARFYNPSTGRFLTQDSYSGNAYDPWTQHLYAYCGNNPINMIDPTGHFFFLVTAAIGAVAGAVIGGVVAVANGQDWKTGALVGAAVGGLVGLGAGAVVGVLLAGSVTASTAAVMTGSGALAATVGGSGLIAGGKMIADNVSQAVNKAPQVFWSGGSIAKDMACQVAQDVGGKTLEMTKLGQYLEKIDASIETWKAASTNFANIANNVSSSIYCVQNSAGVKLQSIWATIEYNIVSSKDIIYKVVSATK